MPEQDWSQFAKPKVTGNQPPVSSPDWSQFAKKKENGDFGDSPSVSSQDTGNGVSPLNIQDINPESIAADLADTFYAEAGAVPANKKISQYKNLVEQGYDAADAADASGLQYTIAEKDDGKYVTPTLSDQDKSLLSDAQNYISQNISDEVDKRVSQNISYYKQQFQGSKKTVEDYEEFKSNVMPLLRERAKYVPMADPDMDDEDLIEELNLVKGITLDAWEDVTNAPTISYATPTGFFGRRRDPSGTEYSEELSRVSPKTLGGYISQWIEGEDPEFKELDYQHDLVNISRTLSTQATDIVRKAEQGFFGGVGEGAKEYVRGMEEAMKSIRSRDTYQEFETKLAKIGNGEMSMEDLSDEEFLLVHSMSTAGSVIGKYKDEVPLLQSAGEMIGQSLGFMGEMLLTGGVGTGFGKGVAASSLRVLSAGKIAPSLTSKLSAKAAGTMAKLSVQTAYMPSFYQGVAEKVGSGDQLDRAILSSYGDTYTELFSESLFRTSAAKLSTGSVAAKFWNRTNSAFGNVTDVRSLIRSTIEETTEEYFSETMNAWRRGDNVYDLSEVGRFMQDTRTQSTIWLSTGIMALGGGVVNTMSRLNNERKYRQLGKSLQGLKEDVDAILTTEGLSIADVSNAIDDAVIDDAVNQKIENPEMVLLNREKALRYAQAHYVREAHQGQERETISAENIVNGTDMKRSDEGVIIETTMRQQKSEIEEAEQEGARKRESILVQEDGFRIESYEGEDTPRVVFEGDTNKQLDKMVRGEAVTREELENIKTKLGRLKKFVTNKKTKGAIKRLEDQANDLYDDLKSKDDIQQDLSNRPSIRIVKNKAAIVPNDQANKQNVLEVTQGNEVLGYMQEDTVNGEKSYSAFTPDNKKLGDYDNAADASNAVLNYGEKPGKTRVYQNTKEKPIEKKDNAIQSMNRIEVNDELAGNIQEDVVGDQIEYVASAFDSKGNKLGEFATQDAAFAAVMNAYRKQPKKKPRATYKAPRIVRPERKILQIDEMSALKTKLQAEQKASREGFLEHKVLTQDISEGLKEAERKGKITTKQATAIISKMANTNLANPVMRERFLGYAEKVFEKAENVDKIREADSNRRKIRKAKKDPNKQKNATLKKHADSFLSLDPRLVEDLDEYNDIATKIRQGLGKSGVRGDKVSQKVTPKYDEIAAYVANEDARQEPLKKARNADLIQSIIGMDELTEEQAQALAKEEADKIKAKVKELLESAENTVSYMIVEKKDPFTGDPINITEAQEKVIRGFLNLNIDKFPIQDVVRIIDALNNFAINQNTNGMQGVLDIYTGALNAEVVSEEMKAFNFFYPMFSANFIGKKIASLPMQLENVFRGRSNAAYFLSKSAVQDFINEKTFATQSALTVVDNYLKDFSKKKANGERFNSLDNIVERGMYAYLIRRADDADPTKDFEEKKDKIKQSIQALLTGNKRQKNMAAAYDRVWNKKFENATVAEDIDIDGTNQSAVQWWIDTWGDFYSPLSEVSESIYNKTLSRDSNYTPMNVSAVKFDAIRAKEANIGESAFHHSAETIFDKESHVLIDAKRYTRLPEGKFINLDFEANMSSILRSALIDMRTASSVKKMQGFFGSSFFNKIFNNPEVAKMVFERVQGLVLDTRGKQAISNKDFAPLVNNLQKVANFAAAKTLGSAAQPIKQTIPVALNTLVNAGTLDFSILHHKDKMDFINRSGEPITLRGAEVIGSVVDMDQMSNMGYLSGNQGKIVGQRLNNFYLNNLLVRPDVYVARASWITYYQQKLKQLGEDVDNIDWKTHEVNREAASHAQAMVDRQQNVSDTSLLGEFLQSRDPLQRIVRGALFPFSNFMFNQKMRIWTDVAVLSAKTSSIDDKKIAARSLTGAMVEQFAFHALSWGIRTLMWNAAHAVVGATVSDDDKEERWKRNIEMYKGNFWRDLVSPFPVVDDIVLSLLDDIVELPGWLTPYSGFTSAGDVYGVYGIGWDKAQDLVGLISMSANGKFKSEFAGRKTTKYLYSEDRRVAEMAAAVYSGYLAGFIPADFGTMARDVKRILEKWAVSESPLKKHEEKINKLPSGRIQTGSVSRQHVGETVDVATRSTVNPGDRGGGRSERR